jgi:2,3-dihydroxybiphenyl 1,2-dioxygenase
MAISALSYLGVRSDSLEDWQNFAGYYLGMQAFDRGGKTMSFRMDDHMQRFVISDEPGETLAFIGWEVEYKDDLRDYADRLEQSGYKVSYGDRALADRRFVDDLVIFHDPAGNRIELVHKPHLSSEPFLPGRPIEGFKTGPYGMGHAVLHVSDAQLLMLFYRDVLGFSVSDYGLTPVPLYFFHVNGRHHSFAIIGSGNAGFHHFMVEYQNLDDVGQGYDLAQQKENGIAYTLGRHTNDYMTSFYAHSPSGFFVENGWGGRVIDPTTWEPHETTLGPSFWGHERLYLPDEARKNFRDMRLKAAQEGKRAPQMADCPWLYEKFIAKR